ncbi:hypothetical protein BAUCODRAFT_118611 [Baudoinia panamericana UAMH 10762]|uniref:NAD(P)-binding protein n=1 Tax=Baudoinia panamericana (strain UAMH 10762) TaxID=717646 RepID=M2M1F8_BAUPA|nr:uncharacterized protein BAUCODRAFT_118611 [Baudoinia panamericana UAMH 10762]EMD00883.1 hypothetical protein BAUCODRAFT_118611 [Baudoinia panamericana UAMH 10762]
MATTLVKAALSPLLTAPALLALTVAPARIREPILRYLREHVSNLTIKRAITALQWLTALGLASRASAFMSELAQNNFRFQSERHRYNWPKEVAIITGAASGFGALMSKSLAEKGVNIVAIDIKDELPADMRGNSKITYYRCDITDQSAVKELAAQVKEAHGAASILINNAGVYFRDDILTVPSDKLHKTFNVNIISHYYMLQAFLPDMIKAKKGHVVSLASMASFVGVPFFGTYTNTKAAVLNLHESLQRETRVLHNTPEIKFTIVHPTFADTPMVHTHQGELDKLGVVPIPATMVTDAIVKQILSGRGRQIIVAPGLEWISVLRALPHWFQTSLYMLEERSDGKVMKENHEEMKATQV